MKDLYSKTAFREKRIIISGGAGDIGLAIATTFANYGANKIALLDKDKESLECAKHILQDTGCEVTVCELDLTNPNAIQQTVKDLYQSEPDWNVLVTTAGFFTGGNLTEIKAEDWDLVMAVNAKAVFLLSRCVAEYMIKAGKGKIVHVGSSSTYYGTPGSGAYSASKVVVNQLTQTMAVEWGPHNIQVNTICPTVTETKFLNFVEGDEKHKAFRDKLASKMPLNRLLQVEDIAPAVLFLASDDAQFINGAIIPIDGGSRLVST